MELPQRATSLRPEIVPKREGQEPEIPSPSSPLHTSVLEREPVTGVQSSRRDPKTTADKPPTMLHIVNADLEDPPRGMGLRDDARRRGMIGPGEHEGRDFLNMIEHVRSHATSNAPGMLAANIRSKRWYVITNRDEDTAQRRFTSRRN